MKTRWWIALFAVLAAVCIVGGIFLLMPGSGAAAVEVYSDGKLLYTLLLHVDTQMEVKLGSGTNVVTVQDGKAAVTQANCPDGYCMQRGFCDGGAQIVCLPNRLVLKFVGEQEVDFVVG